MRTTVGPLPSAVYWRRRAVVLGAVLLGIIVLFVSCSGGGDKKSQSGKAASSNSAIPSASASTPDSDPSFADPAPGGGPSLPDPGSIESQQATADSGGDGATGAATTQPNTGTNVTADSTTCADSELRTTPIPVSTTLKRGAVMEITLTIKNIGTRTCSRDVGSDPQELYLDQGARKYWSSDDCSNVKGNDVRSFAPGVSSTWKITWNGRESSSCTSGQPSGPTPPPGQFDLRARLGTLVSNPVLITIVS